MASQSLACISPEPSWARESYARTVPTRWLLVAAAITAALIVVAGAVWLLRIF